MNKVYKMINRKLILKFIFALGVWSFLLLGLFKLHETHVIELETPSGQFNGRLLLQKDNRYVEATSTTTDRFIPADVLIDNRQGMFNSFFLFLKNKSLSYLCTYLEIH